MSNLWDYVNAINFTKVDLFENNPLAEKDYNAFIINRSLSFFPDAIFYANEMNKFNNIPKKWQFDFLRNSLPKRKRFSKWGKKEKDSNIELIQYYFRANPEKAREILSLLTEGQIDCIKDEVNKGGKNNRL